VSRVFYSSAKLVGFFKRRLFLGEIKKRELLNTYHLLLFILEETGLGPGGLCGLGRVMSGFNEHVDAPNFVNR
jgi:hypothetical protein